MTRGSLPALTFLDLSKAAITQRARYRPRAVRTSQRPIFMQRLKAEDFARIAVRLLFVDINDVNQVSRAIVGCRHRRFRVEPSSAPHRHRVM